MKRYGVLLALAAALAVPASAQAKTLKLSYIEQEDRTADNDFVDADHSGPTGPTMGDYFTGRSNLFQIKSNGKAGKKIGNVQFKGTFVEITSTTYKLRLTAKAKLPGGHVYVDTTETGRIDADEPTEEVGQVDRYRIKRGDGRYKGYTGKVTITVIAVGTQSTGVISRDVFTLKK